ncbi:plant organelle RNA recognition domain-containing protein [Tanacetum coccineum]
MEDIDHKAIKVNSLNMHIIQMGEDKVFVVGHDWGAIIVWQFCLFRPDKVKVEVNSKIASVQGDDSESWVLIPETTFVGVESRVLIPEMTFVGVEYRVLIPETTFVGVESRVLIPETTVWDTLVIPTTISGKPPPSSANHHHPWQTTRAAPQHRLLTATSAP